MLEDKNEMGKRVTRNVLDVLDILDHPTNSLEDNSEKIVTIAMVAALLGARVTEDQMKFAEAFAGCVATYPNFRKEREQELRNENLTK